MRHISVHGTAMALMLGLAGLANADLAVPLHEATQDGPGQEIGTVTISESEHGLVFLPDLAHLEPGIHGFHVHENPSCDAAEKDGEMVPAQAAGGHYDPDESDAHGTPWGEGHRGDLPALYVVSDGTASTPVLAPRLKSLDEIRNRSLMVHDGGDNYSDSPEPLGGGGSRMACGVIGD
ncbi:MAG TPA: superoxide dismutase [Cu-Zn] SodC [Burkholderiaceae bacterium]|nr:superoxide dismutase [Cu-Zn] SodC [Burkholderiaceae bacterium]